MPLSVLAEWQLTFVLAEEVQELLVVAGLQVEQLRDDLVVAARFVQPFADQIADVRSRDLPLHVEGIDGGPEGLTILDEPLVEIVGDGPAPLASRAMHALVTAADFVRQ